MKNLLIVLSLVLGSSAFAAQEIVCSDVDAGPDHGYTAVLNKKITKAKLSTQSIVGPQSLGTLKCEKIEDGTGGFDRMSVYLCLVPGRAGGDVLRVSVGGFAGITSAQLFQGLVSEENLVATLVCR